jgi:hypothetical protein
MSLSKYIPVNGVKLRSVRWESSAYRVLIGKSEGRSPLVGPRRRLEDNIKVRFREIGSGCRLELSGSGWDQSWPLVNAVMNLRIP